MNTGRNPAFVWTLDKINPSNPALLGVDEVTQSWLRRRIRRNKILLRDMLSRWVSELEPAVHARYDGTYIGLGAADDLSLDPKAYIVPSEGL